MIQRDRDVYNSGCVAHNLNGISAKSTVGRIDTKGCMQERNAQCQGKSVANKSTNSRHLKGKELHHGRRALFFAEGSRLHPTLEAVLSGESVMVSLWSMPEQKVVLACRLTNTHPKTGCQWKSPNQLLIATINLTKRLRGVSSKHWLFNYGPGVGNVPGLNPPHCLEVPERRGRSVQDCTLPYPKPFGHTLKSNGLNPSALGYCGSPPTPPGVKGHGLGGRGCGVRVGVLRFTVNYNISSGICTITFIPVKVDLGEWSCIFNVEDSSGGWEFASASLFLLSTPTERGGGLLEQPRGIFPLKATSVKLILIGGQGLVLPPSCAPGVNLELSKLFDTRLTLSGDSYIFTQTKLGTDVPVLFAVAGNLTVTTSYSKA
uniref:Uncharacterized protein n=1 Tax=Timema poppense TaxID=170557 RepID=A0A7R9H0Y6_TIMPO|nr:unnamed protein product [Timema poppensis]